MRGVVIQGKFPEGAPGFPVALPLVQASGLSPHGVRPQMMTSPWKQALAAPLPYRPQAMANAVQPAMANVAVTRKPPVAPPVYRPEQQGIVQHKMLSAKQAHMPPQIGIAQRMMTSPWKQALAAPLPYRPQAMANAVQPAMANVAVTRKPPVAPPVYRPEQQGIVQHKMLSATQVHTPPQIGIAQRRVTGPGVIQCDWFCEACNRHIRYSYDHQPFCRLYHHRTYETASDRAANYYDRPHGETRTRSGSFERQYSSGDDERRHYHENLYGSGGFDESKKGYWDSNGRYHAY